MSEADASPVKPGDILAGKYQVERVLGVGGMGIVVAAKHMQLEERVALKFMLESALSVPEAVQRFLREARAAARLKSEHVAKVTDVGTLENGAPYMVMEYLDGQDLSGVLHTTGRLDPESAVDYVLQACEALAEAHAAGIVHRDLKPANLFLSRRADGGATVKVLDFGISKVSGPGQDMGMTKTTAVMGSPLYMSPEQMKSAKEVDGRTDIWALGVILYELLTGFVPFEADTMPMLIALVLSEPHRRLEDKRPELPVELIQVVNRCLCKTPGERYANVGELAEALAPFASHRGLISVERILGTSGRAPMRSSMVSTGGVAARSQSQSQTMGASMVRSSPGIPTSGSKAPIFVGLAALLAVVGGVGIFFATRSRPAEPATSITATTTTASSTATAAGTASATPSATASVEVTPVAPALSASAAPSAAASTPPTPPTKVGVGTKPPPGGATPPPGGKKPPAKPASDDDAFGGRR